MMKRYVGIILHHTRVLVDPLIACLTLTSLILWTTSNFVVIKGWGHINPALWPVALGTSFAMFILSDLLLGCAVHFNNNSKAILNSMRRGVADMNERNGRKWLRMSIKSQRPLAFAVGLNDYLFYYCRTSTLRTYYYNIADLTITAALSFSME